MGPEGRWEQERGGARREVGPGEKWGQERGGAHSQAKYLQRFNKLRLLSFPPAPPPQGPHLLLGSTKATGHYF